jgi:hypothetical protein
MSALGYLESPMFETRRFSEAYPIWGYHQRVPSFSSVAFASNLGTVALHPMICHHFLHSMFVFLGVPPVPDKPKKHVVWINQESTGNLT